jgi:hypothetical protein
MVLKIDFFISNLIFQPDHIKNQLGPQALAAIGYQNGNQQNTNGNPHVVRTNPTTSYQQHGRVPCTSKPSVPPQQSMMTNGYHPTKPSYSRLCNPNVHRQQQGNRALSASAAGLAQCYNKYNTNMLARPGNQGSTNLTRAHYNPVR